MAKGEGQGEDVEMSSDKMSPLLCGDVTVSKISQRIPHQPAGQGAREDDPQKVARCHRSAKRNRSTYEPSF